MSLVIKLNGVNFNNPNLPTLSGASLVAGNLLDVELGAIGHYLLGAGIHSYSDMTALSNHLSPVNNDPNFTKNSVLVSYANSLNTGIQLDLNSEATLVCVYKNDGTNAMPLGSMKSSSGGTDGLALFSSSDGSSVYFNGRSENSIVQQQLDNVAQGYVFLAGSVGNDSQVIFCPQANDAINGQEQTLNAVGSNAKADRDIYIGSGHYSSGYGVDEVCEVIIFDKALTAQEIEQVYQRSKYRMAKRGIII